jgi:dephospho-CoA kinase
MSSKKIIAFVGMPGSGKGTCTTYLESTYHWPVIHFGNMVYEEVQRRGLDNTKDEIFVREDMRQIDGVTVLAKHVGRRADGYLAEGNSIVVLDGLYSWSEYKYLQEKYGDDLVTIATVAPRQLRYTRILNRQDSHRKYTSKEQIINREVAEIENLEKGGPIAFADYTLLNDSETSTDSMIADLNRLLDKIGLLPK